MLSQSAYREERLPFFHSLHIIIPHCGFYDGRGNSTIGTERLLKFFDETKTMAVITQRTLECSNFSDSGRACFFLLYIISISYSRFLTIVYVSLLQSASDDPHCGKRVAGLCHRRELELFHVLFPFTQRLLYVCSAVWFYVKYRSNREGEYPLRLLG